MTGSRTAAIVLLAFAVAGLTMFAVCNLDYPGLWWDEAAQFWISQGLSNYAEPFAHPAGLTEVMEFNRTQNLDPGGFTVIEHFWTKINRGVSWIRTLPFLFLIVLLLSMAWLGWLIQRCWLMAAVGFSLPLLYPDILYFGLENRAYSMEMAGIVIGLVLLLYALREQSRRAFLLLGISCAVFLTSRYSYVYLVLSVSLVLLFYKPAAYDAGFRRYAALCLVMAVPVLACAAAIFHFMLSRQIWPEMTGDSGFDLVAPVYTSRSVLNNNADVTGLLMRNIFSPAAMPITIAIVYFLFIQARLRRKFGHRSGPGHSHPPRQAVDLLLVFVLCYQCVSIVFSYLGFYPWDIGSRWNAGLLVVSAVAVLALVAELPGFLPAGSEAPDSGSTRLPLGPAIAVALILGSAVLLNTSGYRIARESNRTNIHDQVALVLAANKTAAKVFVTYYEVPVVRYLHEYGPRVGAPQYPGIYRFESYAQWVRQGPIDAATENIRFVITAKGRGALEPRLAGYSLAALGDSRPAPLALQVDSQ